MSDSPGLVAFAIGLVNSVINLSDGQVNFFEEFKLQKNREINVPVKTFLGLLEMMFGLVYASFSLPEWQAVKMTCPATLLFFVQSSYLDLLEIFGICTLESIFPLVSEANDWKRISQYVTSFAIRGI